MAIDIQDGYDAIGGSIQKNQTYKQLSKDYKKLKKKVYLLVGSIMDFI